MKRFITAFLLTAGVCALALAATPLTLKEAEAKALSANPTLQAAGFKTLAAKKQRSVVYGRHFGTLDLVASTSHYNRDNIMVPMAGVIFASGHIPFDANQRRYGIQWQIPLLASGGLHEGDAIAKLAEGVASDMHLFTRDRVRYNVRAAYRNALIVNHALTAAEAYRKALMQDEKDAELKVKLGAWPKVREAKVAYALDSATARVADLKAGSKVAEAVLAALMGENPPSDGFELSDIEEVPSVEAAPLSSLLSTAVTRRGDLSAIRKQRQMGERKKRLAKEAFSPQLVLRGSYLKNDAPSLEDPIDTREITLFLRIPVFNGFSRIHAVQKADADLLAARQIEKAKELEVQRQVIDAQGRMDSARALYEAGKAQRALGVETARVEHMKLEQGTGNTEDYLSALAQKMNGETSYWRGIYTYQSAVDYLDFVTAKGDDNE